MQAETLTLLEWSRLCQHLATFTSTKAGALRAADWRPAEDQAEAQRWQAETQEAATLEQFQSTGLSFAGVVDLRPLGQRASLGGLLQGEDFLAIAATLSAARLLRRQVQQVPDVPTLNGLVEPLRTHPPLEQSIHHCIDDQGEVTDRASPTLAAIRQRRRQVQQQIEHTLQSLLQRHSQAIQEPLITQRAGRYVIPVKANQREAIPGILHDQSTSGATAYIEPQAIVPLGNQWRRLCQEETAAAEAVLWDLSQQVQAVAADLATLTAILIDLDLAVARARYGCWLDGRPPQWITADQALEARQLRHPLLVWQARHESGRPVVPIDVVMPHHLRALVITGPNTGGKTVTLKTLGLAVLMAQAGLWVAAADPVYLPWFDQVLADIGDEQSLSQNLSTFSGHIRRISRILEAATPHSLVLLDEVGAGTDPSEGTALAAALLQHLADRVRLTLATTHFGELKALKYQRPDFENASVEFDDQTLRPTYRLLWGIPGRSNALTIARSLGLAEVVIDQASQCLGGLSLDLNQVIADLEMQRRQQASKLQAAATLLAETERLHRELNEKYHLLQQQQAARQQAHVQALQAELTTARSEIAQVIRKLQQGPVTAHAAQRASEGLDQIAARARPAGPPPPPPGFLPKVGDRVRLTRFDQVGEVLGEVNDAKEVTVRLGQLRMTVPLAEITALDGRPAQLPPPPPPPLPTAPTEPQVRTPRRTLDLRGHRAEDAEVLLEEALSRGHGTLWVVHGKGTGRLRQAVHAYLADHPLVQDFTLAATEEGGAGVTVIQLIH
ncbi:MAG: endonuclease MutS2 [Gloeomargaritaceae cyanobacterium C42_A2020_066]|nr:endonuclease MutS2 [Gloeomargaritaceae cyanobacterium C42_A2020_066]